MPSRKTADGEFKDIAHPINTDTRAMLEQTVIDAYNAELAKAPVEEA